MENHSLVWVLVEAPDVPTMKAIAHLEWEVMGNHESDINWLVPLREES